METIVVVCSGCKARLKIKAPPGRALGEVKCPKCGTRNTSDKTKGGAAGSKPPAEPAETSKSASIPAESLASTSPEDAKKTAVPAEPAGSAEQGLVPVKCDACQWQTKVMQAFIGKKIRCRQCSAIILVGTGTVPSALVAKAASAVPPPMPVAAPPPVQAPVPATPISTVPEPLPVPVPVPMPGQEPPLAVTKSGVLPEKLKPVAPPIASGATQALKVELEGVTSRMQKAEAQAREAEQRANLAEQRLRESEKVLHDLAGKHALDSMATNRKVDELEKELEDFRSFAGKVAADYESEIEAAEKRIIFLRGRLTRFTA